MKLSLDKRSYKPRLILTLVIVIISVTSYSFIVYASAPSGGYSPGITLDPSCVPGSTDCLVSLASVNPIIVANTTSLFSTGLGSITSSAANANFFGVSAGDGATNADNSNFLGYQAGYGATHAVDSNFIGYQAGYQSTNINTVLPEVSNFIGYQAGYQATYARRSNFIGYLAGYGATSAHDSNFIGNSAGDNASSAGSSTFIGQSAGNAATNADHSIFLGPQAGQNATNANNSIFIGNQAGYNDAINNSSGGSSILIGYGTGTGGFSNSIALGSGATNTAANQLMIGSSGTPINDLVISGTGFQTCTVNTTTGAGISCSSDERLKTNISDLATNELDTLTKVRTVNFNWDSNPTGPQNLGFLAQDIQQYYPQLVSTASNGYLQVNYAGITPVLVESIRELNLKLTDIQNFATATDTTFLTMMENWLSSAGNGIKDLYAKTFHGDEIDVKNICAVDASGNKTCITKSQLDQLLSSQNQSAPVIITPSTSSAPSTPPDDSSTQTPAVPDPTITPTPDTSTQTPDVSDPTITQ